MFLISSVISVSYIGSGQALKCTATDSGFFFYSWVVTWHALSFAVALSYDTAASMRWTTAVTWESHGPRTSCDAIHLLLATALLFCLASEICLAAMWHTHARTLLQQQELRHRQLTVTLKVKCGYSCCNRPSYWETGPRSRKTTPCCVHFSIRNCFLLLFTQKWNTTTTNINNITNINHNEEYSLYCVLRVNAKAPDKILLQGKKK